MITETVYTPDEILKGDGRCIDCIEADEFYEATMNYDPRDKWK